MNDKNYQEINKEFGKLLEGKLKGIPVKSVETGEISLLPKGSMVINCYRDSKREGIYYSALDVSRLS